ncbi:MAG TPA: hypothetical protein VNO34_02305 [Actinomycetota bacterium]|nr:hypothetical protein [Actinomycetota bacterium]
MSTTFLATTEVGKLVMSATFVTDFGTAAALSVMFIRPTPSMVPFVLASAAFIVLARRLQP